MCIFSARAVRAAAVCLSIFGPLACEAEEHGPRWLDADTAKSALWVQRRNARTLAQLRADPRFSLFETQAASILTDPGRIEPVTLIGEHVYQYWQERDRPLGVWRRTSKDAYSSGTPAWDLVLDVQALADAEHTRWIFAGASCLQSRCLLRLSRNGRDAVELREFDLDARRFVASGFNIAESKSEAWWWDADTLIVASALTRADATASLLPGTLRVWRRGQQLSAARKIFEVDDSDGAASAMLVRAAGTDALLASRDMEYGRQQFYLVSLDGNSRPIDLPEAATILGIHADRLLVRPNIDWKLPGHSPVPAGSLVAISLGELMQRGRIDRAEIIYSPAGDDAVLSAYSTGERLFVELFHDYATRWVELTAEAEGWHARPLPLPTDRFIELITDHAGELLMREEAPLSPDKIMLVNPDSGRRRTLVEQPAAFETTKLLTEHNRVRSSDGELITYAVTRARDLPFDRCAPTLVYGYGGFDIPLTPRYEPLFGKLWMERGGVYVHAYLRGGGEHGPSWHRSALRGKRQLSYDDMAAVLTDLHRRRISQPSRTGIMGRSNGGLMVATVMQQRPDLLNAVVIGGPLLDMLDYTSAPPGPIWTSEFGDPRDPEARAFLRTYSPMQNIASSVRYPVPLIITSTDDDRVLPGVARRYSARLEALGHDNLYFEDAQGGHYWELAGGPAAGDWRLRATARAVELTYLWRRLADDACRP